MVSVIQRARKLQALLAIRIGPGAAILSPEVTRIHLDFVTEKDVVAKKFWRIAMPRLKYHNPAIPMTVNRNTTPGSPCVLSVHLASTNSASSKPPVSSTTTAQTSSAPPTKSQAGPQTDKVETILMRNKTVSQVLTELYAITKGKVIKPTADEARELRELEEFEQRSAEVRALQTDVNAARKREQAILTQARGEVEAMREV